MVGRGDVLSTVLVLLPLLDPRAITELHSKYRSTNIQSFRRQFSTSSVHSRLVHETRSKLKPSAEPYVVNQNAQRSGYFYNNPTKSWNYDDPDRDWGLTYPICNGKSQSPIALQRKNAHVIRKRPLFFRYYNYPLSGNLTLTNNGHTIDMRFPVATNGRYPFIYGGLLRGNYEAVGFHLHWGSPGVPGSEHVINGKSYDLEIHIVHKSSRYATLDDARYKPDGVAVLGIMMNLVKKPTRYYPGWNKIFNLASHLVNYNSSVVLDSLSLQQVLGDLNTKQFYSYRGSLTTPTCGESVMWHVFPDPLYIEYSQIENLFSLRDTRNKPLIENIRPLQPINGRPVYYVTAL